MTAISLQQLTTKYTSMQISFGSKNKNTHRFNFWPFYLRLQDESMSTFQIRSSAISRKYILRSRYLWKWAFWTANFHYHNITIVPDKTISKMKGIIVANIRRQQWWKIIPTFPEKCSWGELNAKLEKAAMLLSGKRLRDAKSRASLWRDSDIYSSWKRCGVN